MQTENTNVVYVTYTLTHREQTQGWYIPSEYLLYLQNILRTSTKFDSKIKYISLEILCSSERKMAFIWKLVTVLFHIVKSVGL